MNFDYFCRTAKLIKYMDVGDIIYYIVIVIFILFGFFNKSKKEEKKKQMTTSQRPSPVTGLPQLPNKQKNKGIRIERPQQPPPPVKRPEFQSSLNLVMNFEGESSLQNSIYVNENEVSEAEQTNTETVHPIVGELIQADVNELRRAVIYSEILHRKY